MECCLVRVYVWSLGLSIWHQYGVEMEDLPYIKRDNIYYRVCMTPYGVALFIDVTEHLHSLPTPEEVKSTLASRGIKYPKDYTKLYNDFNSFQISNPSSNCLEQYLFR